MTSTLTRLPRRALPRSLRGRLVAATLLAAVALTGGGSLLLHWQVSRGLSAGLDRSLLARATVVAADLQTNAPQSRPPSAGPIGPAQSFTAVVDPTGRIVEADPSIVALPAQLRTVATGPAFHTTPVSGTSMRTVTVPVARPDGTWRVVVGTADRTLDQSEDEVDQVILIAGPLLLLAIAAGSWILAGAALRPVERMRREVSSLAAENPRGRVSEPGDVAELAALGETFNQLLQRLNVSLDRQEGLVADAGHELRTPLAILSVELELADRADRSTAQLREAVDHARTEVARLTRLCEDLLLLAGTTPKHADTVLTRLPDLVAESARAHDASLTRRGISLSLNDRDPTAQVAVQPDALRRTIDNLLGNAARHCPPHGQITVVTYARHPSDPRSDTVLEVQDDGPGFPPGFLPHAFERFRRADPARRHIPGETGTGLGLTIVARIVADHGGSVEAANRADHGALVRISLPAHRTVTTRIDTSLIPD